MSAQMRIRELSLAKLAGRKVDVVGFIDELLEIARDAGEIRCSLVAEHGLRFDIEGDDSCEVELDAGRSKLRMLCARLSVLCGSTVSPYGGEGAIATPRNRWTARFKNTPAEQGFAITPVKIAI